MESIYYYVSNYIPIYVFNMHTQNVYVYIYVSMCALYLNMLTMCIHKMCIFNLPLFYLYSVLSLCM